MTLKVCWFLPLPAATIAEARGFYASRGLHVEATVVRSSDEQYELLAAGAVHGAVTAMDNVFHWNRRGSISDLRIVAQMERSTHSVLMGAPGVDSFEKLKGGILLVDAPDNGFVVVTRAMLRDAGVGPQDYRLKVVGGVMARVEALSSGAGDAALLVPLFEPGVLAAGGHVLGRVDDFYPDFPGQGLAVRRSILPAKMAELNAWIDALREASGWANAYPQEALSIIAGEAVTPDAAMRGRLSAITEDYRPYAVSLERVAFQRTQLGLPGAEEGVAALFEPGLIGVRPS